MVLQRFRPIGRELTGAFWDGTEATREDVRRLGGLAGGRVAFEETPGGVVAVLTGPRGKRRHRAGRWLLVEEAGCGFFTDMAEGTLRRTMTPVVTMADFATETLREAPPVVAGPVDTHHAMMRHAGMAVSVSRETMAEKQDNPVTCGFPGCPGPPCNRETCHAIPGNRHRRRKVLTVPRDG